MGVPHWVTDHVGDQAVKRVFLAVIRCTRKST